MSILVLSDKRDLYRNTSQNFRETNPILEKDSVGYEIDTDLFKIGDGSNPWNVLPYSSYGYVMTTGEGLIKQYTTNGVKISAQFSDETPLPASENPTPGTSPFLARADHVHALQDLSTEYADETGKLRTPVKIGNATFDGSRDITLDEINVYEKGSKVDSAVIADKINTVYIGNAEFNGTRDISLLEIGAAPIEHGRHVDFGENDPDRWKTFILPDLGVTNNGRPISEGLLGTQDIVARVDHQHPTPPIAIKSLSTEKFENPITLGDIDDFDGTKDYTLDDLGAAAKNHSHTMSDLNIEYAVLNPRPDVPSATGIIGSSNRVAREDHQHPMPEDLTVDTITLTTPIKIGNADFIGRSISLEDMGLINSGSAAFLDPGFRIGNVLINGTEDFTLQELGIAAYNHGTHVEFSDETPKPVAGGGSPGSAETVSRSDHQHPKPEDASSADKTKYSLSIGGKTFNGSADISISLSDLGAAAASHGQHISLSSDNPKDLGSSASPGTAGTAARADHVHKLPSLVGRATTADRLTTPISLFGIQFDGSTDIPLSALQLDIGNAESADRVNNALIIGNSGLVYDGSEQVTINAASIGALDSNHLSSASHIEFATSNSGIRSSGGTTGDRGSMEFAARHDHKHPKADEAALADEAKKFDHQVQIGRAWFDGSASISLSEIGAISIEDFYTGGFIKFGKTVLPNYRSGNAGTANVMARSDHVHPDQVNIEGTAAFATRLESYKWTSNDTQNKYRPVWFSYADANMPNGYDPNRQIYAETFMYEPTTDTLKVGKITGTATYLTNTASSANAATPVWFSASGSNNTANYNTGFTYNPSTGTLTATSFNGTASKLTNTSSSTNASSPIWFSNSSDNNTANYNSNFTYNPSTKTLTVTNINGTITNATNAVNATELSSTKKYTIENQHRPIWFTWHDGTNLLYHKAVYDPDFTYEPTSKTLTVTNVDGKASNLSNAESSTNKYTPVWFSKSGDNTSARYNNNFTYNASKDILRVGKIQSKAYSIVTYDSNGDIATEEDLAGKLSTLSSGISTNAGDIAALQSALSSSGAGSPEAVGLLKITDSGSTSNPYFTLTVDPSKYSTYLVTYDDSMRTEDSRYIYYKFTGGGRRYITLRCKSFSTENLVFRLRFLFLHTQPSAVARYTNSEMLDLGAGSYSYTHTNNDGNYDNLRKIAMFSITGATVSKSNYYSSNEEDFLYEIAEPGSYYYGNPYTHETYYYSINSGKTWKFLYQDPGPDDNDGGGEC